MEELPEPLSGRGSVDGAHSHSPRAGAHGHGDDAHGGAHNQQHGGLVERISLWWEGRKSTSNGASAGMEGEAVHTPRGPGHGHGAHALTPRSQDSSLRLSVRLAAAMTFCASAVLAVLFNAFRTWCTCWCVVLGCVAP